MRPMLPYLKKKVNAGISAIHSQCRWLLPVDIADIIFELPFGDNQRGPLLLAQNPARPNAPCNHAHPTHNQTSVLVFVEKSQPS